MDERWKDIPGFEGRYQVSDLGRVRSLDRTINFPAYTLKCGLYRSASVRTFTGKILRPGPSNSGHLSVAICKGSTRMVHQLVMEAFTGPCPDGLEVLHRDGCAMNNKHTNLRYGTRSENIRDVLAHGGRKLSIDDIREIRRLAEMPYRGLLSSLAAKHGVSASYIGNIVAKRNYPDV